MLEAGLHGIKTGAKPPVPVNRNIYDLTEEESTGFGITSLPHDLTHAIDALEADEVVREALGEHIFSEYVRLKRGEWAEYNEQVHRWELDQYMDRY
jgi:glutamine synthetase